MLTNRPGQTASSPSPCCWVLLAVAAPDHDARSLSESLQPSLPHTHVLYWPSSLSLSLSTGNFHTFLFINNIIFLHFQFSFFFVLVDIYSSHVIASLYYSV
ncbi:hypothetical protein BS78_06G024800 [Paspalum vaginatum]|nr:hypothetical protein BS78_06G024800 [Paspalum vaginatum]